MLWLLVVAEDELGDSVTLLLKPQRHNDLVLTRLEVRAH
jgi:hypothetical protein